MASIIDGCFCEKCQQTMRSVNFYKSNNTEKYPNGGIFNQCKKCMTMQVDNWKPETFLWILEEADVPYIESEWDAMLKKYAQDPTKVTGTTVIGRYLAKMKLNQWNKYRWADSERIRQEQIEKYKQSLADRGIPEDEIEEYIRKGEGLNAEKPEGYQTDEEKMLSSPSSVVKEDDSENDLFTQDLTEEDLKYLRMKWGKYSPADWVKLETLWNDMMNSFDIQSAGHKDYLKLCCKASLKTHQLLDISDIDGAQKAGKLYDNLMKSGNFTAAQNKEANGEYVDSISALVLLCEQTGFIPTFYEGKPNDKVDQTIEDLKQYTHSLVTEELNLGNLIENGMRMLVEEQKNQSDNFEDAYEQTSADFEELNKFLEEELEKDALLFEDEVSLDGIE